MSNAKNVDGTLAIIRTAFRHSLHWRYPHLLQNPGGASAPYRVSPEEGQGVKVETEPFKVCFHQNRSGVPGPHNHNQWTES